jgi:hypothetical protein
MLEKALIFINMRILCISLMRRQRMALESDGVLRQLLEKGFQGTQAELPTSAAPAAKVA